MCQVVVDWDGGAAEHDKTIYRCESSIVSCITCLASIKLMVLDTNITPTRPITASIRYVLLSHLHLPSRLGSHLPFHPG